MPTQDTASTNTHRVRILYDDVKPLSLVEHYGEDDPTKPTQDKQCQRGHKEEEIFVVAPTDTVVHPRAMMIKILKKSKSK